MDKKRIVALDVGERRIGVAVSDALGLTAQGVETIWRKAPKDDIARIEEICASYGTDRLLVGLPRSLNGEAGYQADRVKEFMAVFFEKGYCVKWWDERLTTVSATKILLEGDVSRKKRKDVVDMIAATYILQGFMDAGGWKTPLADRYHKIKENTIMEDNSNQIIELFDEENNKVRFEHLMTVPYKDDYYVILAPLDDVEGIGEDEALVLRIDTQDGEEVYVAVEDEDLVEEVFNEYLRLAEEEEDEEEDEEDEK